MTFYPTDCKEKCYNCNCGGAEATKIMYVSIHNVQRVCYITGGAADTDEGEYIAEVIRNNLENMVIPAEDVYPVKHGLWLNHHAIWIDQSKIEGWFVQAKCSECEKWAHVMNPYTKSVDYECCPHCGARMDGDTNG